MVLASLFCTSRADRTVINFRAEPSRVTSNTILAGIPSGGKSYGVMDVKESNSTGWAFLQKVIEIKKSASFL